ncbi:uncharacterized protein LOC143561971 [Bidens hawaiensis]|uniref:uncharacterized protein LOC143561971 n=1 Tax=Bidens hawaiensis TaxID=980011 RepID=UPI0040498726
MMKTKRQNTPYYEDQLLKKHRCSALVPLDKDEDNDHGFARNRTTEIRRDCPFLYTINRQVLDFDFEKKCSMSLSNFNVYACMVCGKYFQGRGRKSHAYNHSLEAGHHVYINLQTEKVYCLPEGYEICDPSLEDVQHVLNPKFNEDQLEQLDTNRQWSRALDGSYYLPGMVGLNNIQDTGFVNVTIQSLMRVTPLRNFFLIPENYEDSKSLLVHRFGELTRKIWHARNFQRKVSPREFLEAVKEASKKLFRSDPAEFMSWLLNTLHNDLKRTKNSSSIIHQCFQGELEVAKDGAETSRMPFLMLGLDLPPSPINPQVSLLDILKKFDGESITEVVRPDHVTKMRYRVTRLPKYLILHMRRFTVEKNPTLVTFPLKNLELKDDERACATYDLIANIVHECKPGEGAHKVFVQHKSQKLWYAMQDIDVAEALPHTVALSEAYMQIHEQQQLDSEQQV